jgi:hypothetical protein
LTLSRTSTVARADATGRARLPRITEYRLFIRSASRPRRSKCFAILDTLLPGPAGGLRMVDLLPELEVGRGKVFSLGRLDVRCLPGLPPEDTVLIFDGEEGRLNLISFPRELAERLSGDCFREDGCDWLVGTTGAGIRLPCATPKAFLECVRYLGAMLAA